MKRLGPLCALGLLTGVLLASCGDDDAPGSESGLGGDRPPCGMTPKTTALAWDEAAPMIGVSAEEAFTDMAGSCATALRWDASGAGIAIDPPSGDTEMRVEVAIDHASALLVEPQTPSGVPSVYCTPFLTVEADVKFETADGVFADSGRVTLSYGKESGAMPLSLWVQSTDLGGSLRAQLKSNQQLSFTYRSAGAGNACVGELAIGFNETHASYNSGFAGTAGSWSNTGCPLGKEPIALDGSSALGTAIMREFEAHWQSTTFAGVWDDDGSATRLQVAITSDAAQACGEMTSLHMVELPVHVVYSTDDGYIEEHATDQHMNFFAAGDSVSQAQLILSESMTCKRGDARFPYLDERCSDYARAEAQIALNRYSGLPESGRLEVYKYKAGGDGSSADDVERLSIGTTR
jgi:hypothetical protein